MISQELLYHQNISPECEDPKYIPEPGESIDFVTEKKAGYIYLHVWMTIFR